MPQFLGDRRYSGIQTFLSGALVSGSIISNGLPVLSGTIDVSGSIVYVGDSRYVLTSSYGPFTASINSFTSSINLFSSSVTSQVNALNTLSQSLNGFTSSINLASSSFATTTVRLDSASGSFAGTINNLSNASSSFEPRINNLNTLSQSLNGFTASFTGSTQAIGDIRYILTSSFSGSVMTVGDSRYILTASIADQRVSSSLVVSGGLIFSETNQNYHIKSTNGALIFSSSVGSIVALSSNLYFPVDAPSQGAHVTAVNSDLILSSSTGSTICVSGNLRLYSPGNNSYILTSGNGLVIRNATNTANSFLVVSYIETGGTQVNTKSILFYNNNWDAGITSARNGVVKVVGYSSSTGSLDVGGQIFNSTSHLVLSSSAGSIVAVSGTLKTSGFVTSISEKLAQYTLTADDYMIQADATSGSFGVVLPAAASNKGRNYIVKKVDSTVNAIVISGSGGTEYIDSDTTLIISSQWNSVSVISNGVKWFIV